jgi:hypothetical protein
VNPADERVRELLDKWLTSLELHLKYVTLDDASYRQVQPWPEHDRPSRWIVEVAKGKARELRDQVEARIKMGDAKFAEALELMAFLVNLVGARVDRFIPLAELPAGTAGKATGDEESTGTRAALSDTATQTPPTVTQAVRAAPPPAPQPPSQVQSAPVVELPPVPEAPIVRVVAVAPTRAAPQREETTVVRSSNSGEQRALKASLDATREMPRPVVRPPDPDDTVETPRARPDARKVTRRETKSKSESRPHHERPPAAKEGTTREMTATVVADAVRLIVWGRKWHELVELIGRFAGRPSASEIRRILKDNRSSIEKTAEKERSKKKK